MQSVNVTDQVEGKNAHDSASVAQPIVIGGVGDSAEQTAVSADGDTTQWAMDTQGRGRVKNYRQEAELDVSSLDDTYDNVTTTKNTGDLAISGYRTATFMVTLAEAGNAGALTFDVEAKDGSNYFKLDNGFLGNFRFTDTNIGSGISRAFKFPLPDCDTMRITVTATGTSASDTFTISNSALYLGT